jgi:hypothetical protein
MLKNLKKFAALLGLAALLSGISIKYWIQQQ